MGLLKRIRYIIEGYIDKIVSKYEDPRFLIDQYIRNMEEEIGNIKGWTADAIVVTKKCKANVEKCNKQIEEIDQILEQAKAENNLSDVERLTEYKNSLEEELTYYTTDLNLAIENENKLREMYDKAFKKLESYRQKRNIVKSRLAVADTYSYMANAADSLGNNSAREFARMEEKATDICMKADAMLSLSNVQTTGIEDLRRKYKMKAIEASS